MHSRGFFYNQSCFGLGSFTLWHGLLLAGILIIVLLAIFVFKRNKQTTDVDIMHLLKEKYALGDITEEEYINKKNILTRK